MALRIQALLLSLFMSCCAVNIIYAQTPPLLYDRLQDSPAHKEALMAIFRGVNHPSWLRQYGYSGQGNPGLIVTIEGTKYEYYGVCKPKDCGDNHMVALFAMGGRQAWALTIEDNNIGYYGKPIGGIREYLRAEARKIYNTIGAPVPPQLR